MGLAERTARWLEGGHWTTGSYLSRGPWLRGCLVGALTLASGVEPAVVRVVDVGLQLSKDPQAVRLVHSLYSDARVQEDLKRLDELSGMNVLPWALETRDLRKRVRLLEIWNDNLVPLYGSPEVAVARLVWVLRQHDEPEESVPLPYEPSWAEV